MFNVPLFCPDERPAHMPMCLKWTSRPRGVFVGARSNLEARISHGCGRVFRQLSYFSVMSAVVSPQRVRCVPLFRLEVVGHKSSFWPTTAAKFETRVVLRSPSACPSGRQHGTASIWEQCTMAEVGRSYFYNYHYFFRIIFFTFASIASACDQYCASIAHSSARRGPSSVSCRQSGRGTLACSWCRSATPGSGAARS